MLRGYINCGHLLILTRELGSKTIVLRTCSCVLYILYHSFISIQPSRSDWQQPDPSHVTGMALAHCILGKFLGVVCHCFPPPLDVPNFVARCLYVRNDARDPSSERWNCGRERCPVILPKFRLPHKFRDLLHAANLRHGTDGFTSPPKEGVLRIFRPKNPTSSAGFEPANLGTKGQHATPRPPKSLCGIYTTKIKNRPKDLQMGLLYLYLYHCKGVDVS